MLNLSAVLLRPQKVSVDFSKVLAPKTCEGQWRERYVAFPYGCEDVLFLLDELERSEKER